MCGYTSLTALVLGNGALLAGLTVVLVSPGAMIVLALLLERRCLRLREQYLAFIIGDPLLALAVFAATAAGSSAPMCGPAGPVAQWSVATGALAFGLWQWRLEVTNGSYTVAQALSPTKIWHQLVIYPTVTTWVWTALARAFMTTPPCVGWTALAVFGVIGWAFLACYDSQRPKLGHVPYTWRRLRAVDRPWAEESRTLRAAAEASGTSLGPPLSAVLSTRGSHFHRGTRQ